MKFEDIEWEIKFPELQKLNDPMFDNMRDAKCARIMFPNGYGVSLIFGEMFYSNGINTYELAVLNPNGITYTTPITNDVLGYLTEDEVTSILQQIEVLPPYTED